MAWWTWDRVTRDTAVTIGRQIELLNEGTRRLLQSHAIILARIADRIEGSSRSEITAPQTELSLGLGELIRGIVEIDDVFIADAQGDRQVSSAPLAPVDEWRGDADEHQRRGPLLFPGGAGRNRACY